MATYPLIASAPVLTTVTATLSSTRRGESGTLYQLFTASTTSGARIERISVVGANEDNTTSTNMQIRVYVTDSNGANPRLLREAPLTGVAIPAQPSIAGQGSAYQFLFNTGLLVGTASEIWVGQQTSSSTNNTYWILEGSSFDSTGEMIYPSTPTTTVVQTATQSTRINPSNLTRLYTAGPNGSRVERITAESNYVSGTSRNKMLRIYIKSGSDYILYREIGINGVTTSAAIYGNYYTFYLSQGGLLLPPNTEIWVGQTSWTTAADTINWIIEASDY